MSHSNYLLIVLVLFCAIAGAMAASQWLALGEDGIHDPQNLALETLQQPVDALSLLTPDTAGNKVNWVEALEKGEISPRSNLANSHEKEEILASKILLKDTANMPMVLFPHETHTRWLACSNCHEKLFKSKAGANDIRMFDILSGKACGQCHGAVAFPLTECNRCHSVTRDSPQARELLGAVADRATAEPE